MGNSANVFYCKTKKRQWSGRQLYLLIQYVHARPADVTHCPLQVSQQPNAKIEKSLKRCVKEFAPKKTQSDEYKKGSIKECLCSSLWWHCKKQMARSEHVWSRDVHTFTTRQSFHRLLCNACAFSGSSRLLTCLRNVIDGNSKTCCCCFFWQRADGEPFSCVGTPLFKPQWDNLSYFLQEKTKILSDNCRGLVYVHISLESEFKRRLSDSYDWCSKLLKG